MTRTELANQAAAVLNATSDHKGKVWIKNGAVRVYLTSDSGGKKGWQDKGFAEVRPDGVLVLGSSVEFALRYDKVVLAQLKALEAVAAAPEAMPAPMAAPAKAAAAGDETVDQFERSERATFARESAREIG